MSRLRQAQFGLTVLFSIGLAVHAARLVVGIDAVQALVMTRAFDSVFALIMLLVLILLWRARNAIDFRGHGDRALFWGTFGYVGLSVLLHARSWVFASATDIFARFPLWYSALFLVVIVAVLTLWWRLRPA